MKSILIIAVGLLIFTCASAPSFAQTRPGTPGPAAPRPAAPQATPTTSAAVPVTRIALVDTTIFGDEKAGVTRYVNAVKGVQAGFQPRQVELNNLQSRIKAIADEIAATYPFHPRLKNVVALFKENEQFKQTRGLIELVSRLLRSVRDRPLRDTNCPDRAGGEKLWWSCYSNRVCRAFRCRRGPCRRRHRQ